MKKNIRIIILIACLCIPILACSLFLLFFRTKETHEVWLQRYDEKAIEVKKGNELYTKFDGIRGEISYITKASFFRMLTLFIKNLSFFSDKFFSRNFKKVLAFSKKIC